MQDVDTIAILSVWINEILDNCIPNNWGLIIWGLDNQRHSLLYFAKSSLATDNLNVAYYSVLRDFDALIISERILTEESVSLFAWRLEWRN